MGDLSPVIGTTGLPALLYYTALGVVSIFFAGWVLNSKLSKICKDNNAATEASMLLLTARVEALEKDSLTKDDHAKDMSGLRTQLTDIQTAVREGFRDQASRIDSLFASKATL